MNFFKPKRLLQKSGPSFILLAFALLGVSVSWAQADTSKSAVPSSISPAPMPMPGMTGSLKSNPARVDYKLGPLGTVYITGIASGLAQWQNSVYPGDHETQMDVSNAQIFIQKPNGLIQYFLQVGGYSIPDLGAPYFKATTATTGFFGLFPQGYLKIAPTKNFSLQAGKLPTLVGAEYTFSFENMNVQRGLLWNQENDVNRGVQANLTAGPVTLAVSWNDGFYSKKYTWLWLSATYTINSANTLTFVGGGNTKHTNLTSFATPLFQNNQHIYGLTYTHTSGKWTVEPYLQYTHLSRIPEIGANETVTTSGAALYVNYSVKDNPDRGSFNMPVRFEYIRSTGSADDGTSNLLYGPGSNAWSFTITPTYQYKQIFVRPEFSFVKADKITNGLALGPTGNNDTQARVLCEVGVLF